MPLKDVLCMDCGHEFEELLRYNDDAVECPHCNSTKVEFLPSRPGGYKINGSNGASTTPRGAGSPKKRSA